MSTEHKKTQLTAEQKRNLLKKALRNRASKVKSTQGISVGQQALWLLHQQAPDSSAYNIAMTTRILSELDVNILQDVFKTLLTRHPSLRATFDVQNNQPIQVLHGYQALDFEQFELTNVTEQELEKRVLAAYHRPFDLASGPLMRVSLFTCKDTSPNSDSNQSAKVSDQHVLLMTVHHIVGDALSIWQLLSDFLTLYPALKNGQSAKLLPLKSQYQDFVAWQNEMLASNEGEKLWQYWQQKLAGDLPILNLPIDKPRPPVQTFNGASLSFDLPAEIFSGLKGLAKSSGATLYIMLMAAFQVLLHRLTTQDDILVGSPTMGRNRSEFENIFGYFVNPIVLRGNLSANPSFNDFLQQTKIAVLEGLAHQDYPFAELVKRLQPKRDISRAPIFQVLFVMQKLDMENPASLFLSSESSKGTTIEQGGLTLSPFKMGQQEGQFDLSLEMVETDNALSGSFRYNADLFVESSIERFTGYFKQLLGAIVANPQLPVSALPMLSEQEHQKLTVDWNNTQADYPDDTCIHQLIEQQVSKTPDAIAVVCNDNAITYVQLNQNANRLAHYLLTQIDARDVQGEQLLIGICLERSIDMIVAIVAVLKAGGAYIPIDPSYPQERLGFMLDDAGMQVLITNTHIQQKLPLSNSQQAPSIVDIDKQQQQILSQDINNPDTGVGADNLIYIIYTSGSTGRPKTVGVYHKGFSNLINWFVKTYEVTSNDRALVISPTSFDLTQKNIFAPLIKGGQLHLLAQVHYEPELISNLVAAQQITWINCASSAFYPIVDANKADDFVKLASMRYVFLGGEPISIKTLWPWLESNACNVKVVNPYGPSECTDICAAYITQNPKDYLDKALPIGKPVDNAEILILGKHLEVLPTGVAGEIHIGGVGVGAGYLNNPSLTAQKFITHPFKPNQKLYKTGDLARYWPDGNIEYLGRIDNQVKVRGFRIELGEIETVISKHNDVDNVVVIVREDNPGNPRIVAYMVATSGNSIDINELRAFCKATLPEFMVPANFVVLDEFPLSANGKTDLKALPAPVEKISLDNLPQTEIEQQIAQIWQEVLHVDKVGIDDNFFELGGHSLLLVQLQAGLKKHFGQQIAIVDLFEYPTIATLGQFLSKNLKPSDSEVIQQSAEQQLQEPLTLSHKSKTTRDEDIAIIGMSARLPGADDVDTYWQNLKNGVESVTFFSDDQLRAAGVDEDTLSDSNYVKASAVLSNIDQFDAAFFDISPIEAQMTDPQHRLFLECAWQALENAGYGGGSDEHSIGVFGGAALNTYLLNNLSDNSKQTDMVDIFKLMIGNSNDFITTRTSYKLNLNGPSVNVQTACSTSLVAVNLACDSLYKGDSDIALAGGVSARVPHHNGYVYQQGMILSPDGHCRAFDADAQGIVGGNGVGIVVLKRLSQAIDEGDNILAVIKGSAINNDGAVKMNFSAPSVQGQAKVIFEAQAKAGVEPESISYIEAHGTGTELGDPIEIAALTKVFTANSAATKNGSVAIGSVKSNIGHTDSAAGVASLIKTVLALQHQQLPPSLHFNQPNPRIDFANSPFYVNSKLTPWHSNNGKPLRAGVSSFGIGGTNAHVILEQAPRLQSRSKNHNQSRTWNIVPLSARTPTALATSTDNLVNFVEQNHHDLNLADIAYTLSKGRKAFEYRKVAICQNLTQVHSSFIVDNGEQGIGEKPAVAFMFSGQGAQYVDMGLELYQTETVYQQQVDYCCEYLMPLIGHDLRETMYPSLLVSPTMPQTKQLINSQDAAQILNQTIHTQVALFVSEYALAKLWMSWGVMPEAMIGHSIGEYVAACLAQVFSLDDALSLVAARAQLMQSVQGEGAMLAVPWSEQELRGFLSDYCNNNSADSRVNSANSQNNPLEIAAINTPERCVVAGPSDQIDMLSKRLAEKGIQSQRLHTSHAFHSGMMDPILTQFTNKVAQIDLQAPKLAYVSNVTGDWITNEQATNPHYWAKHLRHTVKFSQGVEKLLDNPNRLFVEVGPGRTLSVFAKAIATKSDHHATVLNSLRHPQQSQSDTEFLLTNLAKYWAVGGQVDWTSFYANERRLRLPLPTYPFERKRYWIEAKKATKKASLPWSTLLDSANKQAQTGNELLKSYEAGQHAIEQLSLAYINKSLKQLDVFTGAHKQLLSLDEILSKGNIAPRYHQLVSHWLNLLVEHGQLQYEPTDTTNATATYCQLAPINEISELVKNAKAKWPEIKWVERMEKFGDNLASMLTGDKEPLELSFSQENFDTKVQQSDMPLVAYFNTIIAKCVEQKANSLGANTKLKVLELGAGMGLTTTALLPILPANTDEYAFTDIGQFFLRRAQQQFGADYPFMTFKPLNIDNSPQEQGFKVNSYHVVVATMMLHVVKDIAHTIKQARSLLAPGGLLVFMEGTKDLLDFEITDGLLMDALDDGSRNQGNPFLSSNQWQQVLKDNGFKYAAALPSSSADTIGYQVFVAQADDKIIADIAAKPLGNDSIGETEDKEKAPRVLNKKFVAPTTTAQKAIADIWSKALGIESVGINDNFFDLGGDSLLAIGLVTKLNNAFNCEISLSQVIDAPTVEKLALLIEPKDNNTEQRPSILVELQPNGTNPPLFCIHPGGGAVFPFIKLAEYLGDDQPLYAIQSPGLIGQEEFTCLATRASHYIAAIKSVQREGPYYLTGMSFGGNMALEMAIQLKKQGDEVALVGMFDSYPPVSYQTQVDDHQKFLQGFLGIVQLMFNTQMPDFDYHELSQMDEQNQWEYILEKLGGQLANASVDGSQMVMTPKMSKQLFNVWKSQHTELKNHNSEIYSGHITLFQAMEKPPQQLNGLLKTNVDKRFIIEGWNQISKEPIERMLVPGNHFTLLDEPHVQAFAQLLKATIYRAQAVYLAQAALEQN